MTRRTPQPHDPSFAMGAGIPVVLRIGHAKSRRKRLLSRKRLPINMHGAILAGSLPMLTLAIWVGWQLSGPPVDLSSNGPASAPLHPTLATKNAEESTHAVEPFQATFRKDTTVVAETSRTPTVRTVHKPIERRGPKVLQAAGFEVGDTEPATSRGMTPRTQPPHPLGGGEIRNRTLPRGKGTRNGTFPVGASRGGRPRSEGNVRIENVTPVYSTDEVSGEEGFESPVPPPPNVESPLTTPEAATDNSAAMESTSDAEVDVDAEVGGNDRVDPGMNHAE
ncbi:MAG: hypothetical protein U1D30_06340 [Planctomycetota bacterium]